MAVERTGHSLHLWLGPLGLHLWRHGSTYRPWYLQFAELDWAKPLGLTGRVSQRLSILCPFIKRFSIV